MGTRIRYWASVLSMRTASGLRRVVFGVLFALLLSLRLLSPPGFMPSFENGAVTIVACPAAFEAAPAPAMHHHHGKAKHQQPCPYASASAFGALFVGPTALLGLVVVVIAQPLERAFEFNPCPFPNERPPSRGPPLSA